nr:MAG TPA: hemolysin [Caudoviricetes sp.]
MTDIIVALIALLGSAAGSLSGILVSSKLTAYRLEQLEKKVEEHNKFARRLPVAETRLDGIEHRLEDLEHERPNR